MRYLLQHDHRYFPATAFAPPLQPPGASRHGCSSELLRQPARLAPGGGAATGAREGVGSGSPTLHSMRSACCPLPGAARHDRRPELLRWPARGKLLGATAGAAHPHRGGAAAGVGPEVVTPPEFRREVVLRRMHVSARGPERNGAGELVWFKEKGG
jgi:hypothetical protein